MSLNPERAEAIFTAALAQPSGAERLSYIKAACRDEPDLLARVEALLQAHDGMGSFLQPITRMASAFETIHEGPGSRIGRYKLLQLIGEGGFGSVFMAEQEEPVRRRVALKIVKLGMDTRQVIARFEAERQALALMEHPNIAKAFDAGATDTGRPFFVMELVKGVPITEYCDKNNLSTRERLDLFISVCNAVQHAHQKGVIHRDIKPSNVLVTLHDGKPVPKVIDFGIAKATSQRLTEKTVFTEFKQFIGTPAYTSPEQAEMSGLDVDTRSDIYSLGVLLYELLTGATPFDPAKLRTAAYAEIQRIIREVEPPRPSVRLSTLGEALTIAAKHRSAEPAQLSKQIRGDLDWIVMKCLEKDRTRRYETANGLAADVRRHLSDDVIVARPPSAAYRVRKMVRRNKVGFAALIAVSIALVIGGTLSIWQAIRATHAERQQIQLRQLAEAARNSEENLRVQAEADEKKAQTEAARSEQVAKFMKDMLKNVGPRVALGRDTALLHEILDQTALRLATDLKGQPEVEADLRETLGMVYNDLSQYSKAEEMLRESLRIRKEVFGNEHFLVASVLQNLSTVIHSSGTRTPEAISLAREALAMRRKLLGNDNADVADSLNGLAGVLKLNDSEAAEPIAREALALRRKLSNGDSVELASALSNLGLVLNLRRKYPEAEAMQREALAMRRKRLTDEHPDTAGLMANLGITLWEEGKLAEAEANIRQGMMIQKRLLPAGHRDTAGSTLYLGRVLASENKLGEAESTLREAAAMYDKIDPESSSYYRGLTASVLRNVLERGHKLAEAEKMYRDAVEEHRSGPERLSLASSLGDLADFLARQGKFPEAEHPAREALAVARNVQGDDGAALPLHLERLGAILVQQGKRSDSETFWREALAIRQKGPDAEGAMAAQDMTALAFLLFSQGKVAEAEALLQPVALIWNKTPEGVRAWRPCISILCGILLLEHKSQEAHELFVAAASYVDPVAPKGDESWFTFIEGTRQMSMTIAAQGGPEEGLALLEEAMAAPRPDVAADDPRLLQLIGTVGAINMVADRNAEAITAWERALALSRNSKKQDKSSTFEMMQQLGIAYREAGRLADAQHTFEEILQRRPPVTNVPAGQDPNVTTIISLGKTLRRAGQITAAKEKLRAALDLLERDAPANTLIFQAKSELGAALLAEKNFVEAEPLLVQGAEGLIKEPGRISGYRERVVTDAVGSVIQLYTDWHKPDRAAEWNQRLAGFENASAAATQPSTRSAQ